MWLCTGHSALSAGRSSFTGSGMVDAFFDYWLPVFVHELRFGLTQKALRKEVKESGKEAVFEWSSYEWKDHKDKPLNTQMEEMPRRGITQEFMDSLVIADKNGKKLPLEWKDAKLTTDFDQLKDQFPMKVSFIGGEAIRREALDWANEMYQEVTSKDGISPAKGLMGLEHYEADNSRTAIDDYNECKPGVEGHQAADHLLRQAGRSDCGHAFGDCLLGRNAEDKDTRNGRKARDCWSP